MSKSKQAVEPKTVKSGPKPEPAFVPEQASEQLVPVGPTADPFGAAGGGSIQRQAARLGDARFGAAQREAMAGQIGRLQGNQHLLVVVTSLRQSSVPAAPHASGNGHGGNGSRTAAHGTRTATPAEGAELGAGEEALGAGSGLPIFAPAPPPPSSNGNGHRPFHAIQRQDEEQAEDEPTEEEKQIALANARAAEAEARKTAGEGKQKVEQSKAAKAAEAQAAEVAKQKAGAEKGAAGPAPAKAEAAAKGKTAEAAPKPPGKDGAKGNGSAVPKAAAAPLATAVDVAAPGYTAPASPDQDPAFLAVVKGVKGVAAEEQAHEPAAAKAKEAQDAAESPAGEKEAQAQDKQVADMDQAETPGFNARAFKAQLMQRIQELAPKNAEQADNFKEESGLGGVKDEMKGKVAEEKDTSQGAVKEATEKTPDVGSIPDKPVTPLEPADAGSPPPDLAAEKAAPKPKGTGEVEKPLHDETKRIDQEMAAGGVSEEQLAKSNEPAFQSALDAKKEAKAQAAAAGPEYRAAEGAQIAQSEGEAAATTQERTQAMHGDRAQLLGQVAGRQGAAKSKDEAERAKVASDIQKIYDRTKTNVERILGELDGKVDRAFDEGAREAKQVFEEYVDAKMEAFKEKRYGGWFGWARWAKDKIAGMPDEVNVFYQQGRDKYLQKMDAVIDNVVSIIGRGLAEAKAEITRGKKEIQTYVAGLPQNLQKVGQEAADNINDQFAALEDQVNSKQSELIDRLAQKYQENLQAVDARIEELKAANKGLVDRVVDAVKGVIETIRKLKAMLDTVLAKISDVVGLIIDDPIGFLGNLISGLKQGFDKYVGNIATHLQKGLIGWLTGAMQGVNIQMPDDIFSLKGIFSLVMQILGLTWNYIRAKAVKLLGERVVKALETGFEIFNILMTQGPIGLWEYVKDQFSDLKEMVMDAIKDMVIVEVIKAGVKWVLGLLNPVGAFIKACMAIYEIVMFFVNNAERIMGLISAIVDAAGAIARGAISTGAKLVEDALGRLTPLIIGFLASLLGISGLANKVMGIIKKVRGRIDKMIDGLILKAKKAAGKLLKKIGIGKDKTAPAADNPQANSQARAKARQRVASATRSPFKDEKDLKAAMGQIERDLKPEGLKSLAVKPKTGKVGGYDVVARETEDVGDAQVGETGDAENELRLLMEELTGGTMAGSSSYQRESEALAASTAVPRETRLTAGSAAQSETALLGAIARIASLPGKTDAQLADAKKRAEQTVRSRIKRALGARDGDAIFRNITAAQEAVNKLVKQNLVTIQLKQKKGHETHHMQEVHEEPGTFPKTFRARVRIPDKWKQQIEQWAADLAAKKKSMSEAELKRRRRELAKLVRDSLEEEKREQPHRSRAVLEEVDMIVTIGELHQMVHQRRELERTSAPEGSAQRMPDLHTSGSAASRFDVPNSQDE